MNFKAALVELRKIIKPKTLILLNGDLGAGKTTLIVQLLETLGYMYASSPTYALRQTYENIEIESQKIDIEHIDLYRLKNEDDIESIGLWDVFQNENSVVMVEWESRISRDLWPLNWSQYLVEISKKDEVRNYIIKKL